MEYFIYRSKRLCMPDTMLKWNGGVHKNVRGKGTLIMLRVTCTKTPRILLTLDG